MPRFPMVIHLFASRAARQFYQGVTLGGKPDRVHFENIGWLNDKA